MKKCILSALKYGLLIIYRYFNRLIAPENKKHYNFINDKLYLLEESHSYFLEFSKKDLNIYLKNNKVNLITMLNHDDIIYLSKHHKSIYLYARRQLNKRFNIALENKFFNTIAMLEYSVNTDNFLQIERILLEIKSQHKNIKYRSDISLYLRNNFAEKIILNANKSFRIYGFNGNSIRTETLDAYLILNRLNINNFYLIPMLELELSNNLAFLDTLLNSSADNSDCTTAKIKAINGLVKQYSAILPNNELMQL